MLNTAFQLLDFMLRRERSLVIETEAFRSMKHNADLCPRVRSQIETVLKAFGRFEPIVYDTQGFGDDGVDLVVRVERERQETADAPQVVGLQVKSYEDFRRKGMLRELKAQHDDARRKVQGLKEHFILLCTDEDEHKDAIRTIEAEFRSAPDTFIIEPTFAYGFLTMPTRRIEGLVGRAMQSEDIVFRRALETVDVGHASAGILAVYVAGQVLGGILRVGIEELIKAPAISGAYAELREAINKRYVAFESHQTSALVVPIHPDDDDGDDDEDDDYEDYDEQRRAENELLISDLTAEDLIAHDLEVLDTKLIDIDPTSATVVPRLDDIMPIVALLADAQVRYEMRSADLVSYGLHALGLLELR